MFAVPNEARRARTAEIRHERASGARRGFYTMWAESNTDRWTSRTKLMSACATVTEHSRPQHSADSMRKSPASTGYSIESGACLPDGKH